MVTKSDTQNSAMSNIANFTSHIEVAAKVEMEKTLLY